MRTTTVWTTIGWVEYLDIGFSDYSDNSVDRSNVTFIIRDCEEKDESEAEPTLDGSYHLAHLAYQDLTYKDIDGNPYYEPRATPDGDATVVRYYGGHGSAGVLVKLGTEYGDRIAASLENYPLLDDELHSEEEERMCEESWDNMTFNDRLQYLKPYLKRMKRDGVSAEERYRYRELARRPWAAVAGYLNDDNGYIRDRLIR